MTLLVDVSEAEAFAVTVGAASEFAVDPAVAVSAGALEAFVAEAEPAVGLDGKHHVTRLLDCRLRLGILTISVRFKISSVQITSISITRKR